MQSELPLNQDVEITGDKGGLIWAPGVIKVGQHIMSDAATMKYVDYPRYLDGAPVNSASNGGAAACLPPPAARRRDKDQWMGGKIMENHDPAQNISGSLVMGFKSIFSYQESFLEPKKNRGREKIKSRKEL